MITNPEILSQVRKVLRAKIGDSIRVQDPTNKVQKIRYEVQMQSRNDKDILWKILSEHIHELTPKQTRMIVAMPNKWEKAELIAQKLSEIGISEIIFWPSERSVIKTWSDKKEERLQKIIKEAVEQSWWRSVPELHFAADIQKYLQDTEVIIFDKSTDNNEKTAVNTEKVPHHHTSNITGIIGPEWWLTTKDYQQFQAYHPHVKQLGATVLRMETAAIVWWRLIKNDE